jgi:hypothetical protein
MSKRNSVEQAVERSVKMAETASSELSAKLEIGESEIQAALLLTFLAWNSFVMFDWSAWTSRSPDSSDGEIRRTRDEALRSSQEWIAQQVNLLVLDGRLAPEKRHRTMEVLTRSFDELFGLPLLPATRQEDSVLGCILRKLEQEYGFPPSVIQAVKHKLYVVMDRIQNGKALLHF